MRASVTGISRIAALLLALTWLAAGVGAIAIGYSYARPVIFAFGFLALFYGLLWVRVVAQRRLLTWRDIARPWQAQDNSAKGREP